MAQRVSLLSHHWVGGTALITSSTGCCGLGLLAGSRSRPTMCLGLAADAEDKPKKLGPLQRWMRRKGVTTSDMAKVATSFYAAKWVTFAACLGLCVRFQPLRRTFKSGTAKRFLDDFISRHPKFYRKTQAKVLAGADRLAASRFFKPIPYALGTKPKLFALALAENIVLYKLTFPLHAPLELWLIINFYANPEAAAAVALEDAAVAAKLASSTDAEGGTRAPPQAAAAAAGGDDVNDDKNQVDDSWSGEAQSSWDAVHQGELGGGLMSSLEAIIE
eukprot:COSAG05_NODE_278_length_12330_cov_14.132205_11_plen_275_part_00